MAWTYDPARPAGDRWREDPDTAALDQSAGVEDTVKLPAVQPAAELPPVPPQEERFGTGAPLFQDVDGPFAVTEVLCRETDALIARAGEMRYQLRLLVTDAIAALDAM